HGSQITKISRLSSWPDRKTPDSTGGRRRSSSARSRRHFCRRWRWPAMRPSGCSGSTFATSPLAAHGSTPTSGSAPHAIGVPVGRSATPPARSICVPRRAEASGRSSATTWGWWGCLMASPRSSSRPSRKAEMAPRMCSSRESRGKEAITDEVKKQNQEVKTTWHLHDVLVSDDHGVALLEAEQEGRRRRIVHVLHLDDTGRIQEAWAVFNPTD